MMTQVEKLYQQAFEFHYTWNDLTPAMKIYQEIISSFPNSLEAEYSISQIKKIEKSRQLSAQLEKERQARVEKVEGKKKKNKMKLKLKGRCEWQRRERKLPNSEMLTCMSNSRKN